MNSISLVERLCVIVRGRPVVLQLQMLTSLFCGRRCSTTSRFDVGRDRHNRPLGRSFVVFRSVVVHTWLRTETKTGESLRTPKVRRLLERNRRLTEAYTTRSWKYTASILRTIYIVTVLLPMCSLWVVGPSISGKRTNSHVLGMSLKQTDIQTRIKRDGRGTCSSLRLFFISSYFTVSPQKNILSLNFNSIYFRNGKVCVDSSTFKDFVTWLPQLLSPLVFFFLRTVVPRQWNPSVRRVSSKEWWLLTSP